MSDTKLCKDCRWVRTDITDWVLSPLRPYRWAQCGYPDLGGEKDYRRLVDGHGQRAKHYCTNAREFTHLCGPEAQHWEAKDAVRRALNALAKP